MNELYFVGKCWDNVPDGIIKEGLTKEEADKLKDSLIPSVFTSYDVKPMKDKIYFVGF